ncbi:methyl-accepting chemotaxis protein [Marinilactibacillus psychrotolerans]|uniref:Sensory transducer protein YvaQ n=1 Tax=Marinilactibacillus psychrotolerans TaxID=191770 RepID=A0AAV3WP45_9LACT|nr:methyl-accepting chemotaxis protein [Marinilactibacillus psychrotolerans]GEL65888.1 putative sensory transducer protein YvaQ [Marinilactibacillus psychrotolerans]GEQ34836.1 putative sensory transducer protein YvaQ [Marinilactibacillus psychrotolerans]SDC08610.1 methyl-accepting chemotaxis protein [Marinilactibacillus psychrotolerans]
MKITTKLIISYLSLAVIVIILGALSFLGLDRIYSNANELYNQRLQPSITLTEMAKTMENTRVQMLSGVANEDSARGEKAITNIERIDELITDYENRNMEKRESEKFSELKQNWQDFTEIVRQNVETLSAGMYIETLEGLGRGADPYTAASTNVSELIEIVDDLATKTYENDKEVYDADRFLIILASILATILAIVIGVFMGRIIGVPLKKVSQKLDHISKGDLTEPVEVTKRKDEIGILINATSKMQEELKNLINSVADATVQVLSSSEELTQSTNEVVVGAEQVATTMQELATGAEAQANSTSEFSEHMQKFSETIEDSSKESEKIYQTSTNVYSLTKDGREMMANSVSQMQSIDNIVKNSVDGVKELDVKSGEISKLVGVIESIAEQTNLLALNAAIEAARVGDQGKGFAVVADEIRQLAEQVSVSVVDITDIVNNIQSESAKLVVGLETGYEQVEKGTSQIQQTGETFNKISSSVESMGNAIKEISNKLAGNRSTTKNMSTNIEEIAGLSEQSAAGIEQTSATAQQTTSTMQEVSSSSEELANLAEKLSNLVERFKI